MLNYACWVKQRLIQRLFSLSLMIKLSTRFNLVLVTIFLLNLYDSHFVNKLLPVIQPTHT